MLYVMLHYMTLVGGWCTLLDQRASQRASGTNFHRLPGAIFGQIIMREWLVSPKWKVQVGRTGGRREQVGQIETNRFLIEHQSS